MGCMIVKNTRTPIPIAPKLINHNSVPIFGNFIKLNLDMNRNIKEVIEDLQNKVRQDEEKVISRLITNEYCGEGIRRTRAYETKLTRENFIKARQLFWNTKINQQEPGWTVLKTICEVDYGNYV